MHSRPRLLLVGLGHAHLFVLEAARRGRLGRAELHLVTPGEYLYSGMIPGVLAGCYRADQAAFDVAGLARAAGAAWIEGRAARVDFTARRVALEDGSEISYDLLSLDIGSATAGDDLPGVREHAHLAKPVSGLLDFGRAAEAAERIAVVGGGASGVETLLCLTAAFARRGRRPRFTLLEAGAEILAGYGAGVRRRARALLAARGVEIRTGERVARVVPGSICTEAGEELGFDALLWATGPSAPSLPAASELPTDSRGYLLVEPTLRVAGHRELFAAGDCAALVGYPWVPRAGVYAVREGAVLARNLARSLSGSRDLERYRPQRHWLSLMNTGDGRALLAWRGLSAHARAAWRLKDWLDRRFVGRMRG